MEFRLLGPLEVRDDAGRIVSIGRPKVRALLAILLLHQGRPVPRTTLINRLWAGTPPGNPVATLQSHVAALRRTLEPGAAASEHALLATSASGYRLQVSPEQLDVARFDEARRAAAQALSSGEWVGARDACRRALDLWRGPALADLREHDFARAPAARLDEQRWSSIELLAEARLRTGEYAAAVEDLYAHVAQEPLRERLWELLMLALYRSGRQSAALEAYQDLRVTLADIGLEPGPGVRRLESEVLRQTASLDHPWPPTQFASGSAPPPQPPSSPPRPGVRNAPELLSRLIGRGDETAEVARLLERARLVTLTGPGGIGKTRLGLAVAERVAARSADRVAFVDLAATSRSEEIFPAVARQLGAADDSVEGSPQAVRELLGSDAWLIVLDNLEQLPEVDAAALELLSGCPELRILGTSRRPLRLPAEHRYHVPPLELPPAAEPVHDEMTRYSAVALYLDRAAQAHPELTHGEDDLADIVELCRLVDGSPLAIELVASRAGVLPPRAFLDHVATIEEVEAQGTGAWRHRSLHATVAWSYGLLGEEARALLRQLAVAPAGMSLTAVRALAAVEDGAGVVASLTALVDASLIATTLHDGGARYTMTDPVRRFALGRLQADGRSDEAHARYLDHLLDIAEHDQPPIGHLNLRRLASLDAEADNLVVLLDWAEEQAPASAARLMVATSRWWLATGRLAQARSRAARLLAGDHGLAPATVAELTTSIASLAANEARFDEALEAFAAAVELWDEIGNAAGRARCAYGRAAIHLSNNDVGAAEPLLAEAARLAERIGDDALTIRVLSNIAAAAEARGDYDTARREYGRAMATARRIGSHTDLARTGGNLGVILAAGQDHAEATRLAADALEAASSSRAATTMAIALVNAGVIALLTDDHDLARRRYAEALGRCSAAGLTAWVFDCLQGLAAAVWADGDAEDAGRLIGAADGLLEDAHLEAEEGLHQDCYRRYREAVAADLGPGGFARAAAEGRQTELDALVEQWSDPGTTPSP